MPGDGRKKQHGGVTGLKRWRKQRCECSRKRVCEQGELETHE